MVYRALNATICLFIGELDAAPIDHDNLLEQLAEFLDRSLCSLASKIGDGVASIPRTIQTDTPYHFIYFNSDSLSVRSSFPTTSLMQSSTAPMPPPSFSKLVYETYDHFGNGARASPKSGVGSNFAEIYVKDNDWWLVLKKSNGRTLALFIPQWTSSSQSTIVDAHDCAENIIKSHFDHIFAA